MKNEDNYSKVLDYSVPEDAAVVLNRLGGEELLKAEFPDLYAAFLRTQEAHAHRKMQREQNGNSGDDMTSYALAEDVYISKASPQEAWDAVPVGIVQGVVKAQSSDTWLSAMVNAEMMNQTQSVMLDNYSLMLSATNKFEHTLSESLESIHSFDKQTVQNCIFVDGVRSDGMMESCESKSSIQMVDGDISPVLRLFVTDPKSTKNNNPIIVVYDRPPDEGEVADYSYPENHKEPDPSHRVNTELPVNLQITFNPANPPIAFDEKNSTTPPTLFYENEGVVQYFKPEDKDYKVRLETLAKGFEISKTAPNVATMTFGPDWQRMLDISSYTQEHRGTVYLNFGFRVKCKLGSGTTSLSVLLKSVDADKLRGRKYYESSDLPNVYIPPIKIKWGCFAKDTLFRMADGSLQRGEDIRPGNFLLAAEGRPIQVLDAYRGHEAELYSLCTHGGKTLRVTKGHPIVTPNGIRRVEHLQPGDSVLCKNDETDEVRFVYTTAYNDTICNFEFRDARDGVVLLANGIQAGDFNLQNQNLDGMLPKQEASLEAQKAAADLKRLKERLDLARKG